jgi:hypothetical protein
VYDPPPASSCERTFHSGCYVSQRRAPRIRDTDARVDRLGHPQCPDGSQLLPLHG